MSDGDPGVSCVKRKPSHEAFDQRGEHSYPIRVSIAGGEFFRTEEGVDSPRDITRGVGRQGPVRVKGFTQRGFLAWAELVMEEFRSNRSNGISEI